MREFRNGYSVNEVDARHVESFPGMRPIGDWLVENFGEEAAKIEGVNNWGGWYFTKARFINGDGHALNLLCGGVAIIIFERGHTVDKNPFYLVADDLSNAMVSILREAGMLACHQRSDHARLKLVASA